MEESLSYETNHKTSHSINVSPVLAWVDKYFNTEDIKQSLLALPDAIAAQKSVVRKLRDTFQEADLPRKMMELEMIDDIAGEKNSETGKAMYSNDKLRDAELKRRKAGSEEYQDYQQQAKGAERELSAAEDELARLEQGFSAYQYVSNFVAAEMNLVAGLMKVPGGVNPGNGPGIPGKLENGQPY